MIKGLGLTESSRLAFHRNISNNLAELSGGDIDGSHNEHDLSQCNAWSLVFHNWYIPILG